MKREDIEKQLNLLERVAEKLVNGCLTSGNIAHDGKTKGYTIQNVVGNIRKILDKEKPTTDALEKLVSTSYENGYKQCKEDMIKNAIDAEILEFEDDSCSMNAHTHLEIYTDEDLEKNYKDGDKLSLIILKKE